MELFISILSAMAITIGIIAMVFRERFILIDEFGSHIGVAFGLTFITGGLSLFLLFNGVLNG